MIYKYINVIHQIKEQNMSGHVYFEIHADDMERKTLTTTLENLVEEQKQYFRNK